MRRKPAQHPATGVGVDARHLARALAAEATSRWLGVWNEGFTEESEWERLEVITIAVLPPFGDHGIPIALLRGHDSGALMVLFFRITGFMEHFARCLDPKAIGFDVDSFKPPAQMPRPIRCVHQWYEMLEDKLHTTTHVCKEPSGHDEGKHPTPHVCTCGTTLPSDPSSD